MKEIENWVIDLCVELKETRETMYKALYKLDQVKQALQKEHITKKEVLKIIDEDSIEL